MKAQEITVITKADLKRLREMPKNTKVRAFKYVTRNGFSPSDMGRPILTKKSGATYTYEVGQTYFVNNANTDEGVECAAGIYAGTSEYILDRTSMSHKVLILEFRKKDIAAIPTAGFDQAKFRMRKVKVVGEFIPSYAARFRDKLRHFRKHAR